jgi:hypothetical protein
LAKVKAVFAPFIVPAGISASTKTALDPLALSVSTVAASPVSEFLRLVTDVLRPPTVVFRLLNELVCPPTVEVRAVRLLLRVEIEPVCPLTVEPKPLTVEERPVKAVPFVLTVELNAATLELSPPTVVPRPVTVPLKLLIMVCRAVIEPAVATAAAKSVTWEVSEVTEPLIKLKSALRFVTWLIAIGSVAYGAPGMGPEPLLVLDTRIAPTVSSVVLGGTCHVSLQVTSPLLLLYATR